MGKKAQFIYRMEKKTVFFFSFSSFFLKLDIECNFYNIQWTKQKFTGAQKEWNQIGVDTFECCDFKSHDLVGTQLSICSHTNQTRNSHFNLPKTNLNQMGFSFFCSFSLASVNEWTIFFY